MIGLARVNWLRWVKDNPFAGRYTPRVLAGKDTKILNDAGKVDGEGQAKADAAVAEVREANG